mgnify:CR=1 FL=1
MADTNAPSSYPFVPLPDRGPLRFPGGANVALIVTNRLMGAMAAEHDPRRRAEIGAGDVPELVVINKADVADPMVVARLQAREPHSVVVSARTGEGIAQALLAVDNVELPRRHLGRHALRFKARRESPGPSDRRQCRCHLHQ